jgi:glycerate kinase
LADDARGVFEHGIDGLESATARDMDLATALKHSRQYLEDAGERVIRMLLIGMKMQKKGWTAPRAEKPGAARKKRKA